jgi:hypothetical protein
MVASFTPFYFKTAMSDVERSAGRSSTSSWLKPKKENQKKISDAPLKLSAGFFYFRTVGRQTSGPT